MTLLTVEELSDDGAALGFMDGQETLALSVALRTYLNVIGVEDSALVIKRANFTGPGYEPAAPFRFSTFEAAVSRFAPYLTREWRYFEWHLQAGDGSPLWHLTLQCQSLSLFGFGPVEVLPGSAESLARAVAKAAARLGVELEWRPGAGPPPQ